MIRVNFYDALKDELAHGGLWEWAKDRPYREVIAKPEVVMAHERAWRKYQESNPQPGAC